ncbi:CpaD family pilus assembly lipoprotein [Emcibacter sp. SYSU 3D8]|uniref:CpaD family pilus assembly lipoprotein n=1 Tax=Emcibacter sp. SYSU 3D8 TaxID=3133969 RepID=UPI0031FEF00C
MTLYRPAFALRSACLTLGMVAGVAMLAACGTNNNYMPPRTGYLDTPPRSTVTLNSLAYRLELGRGQTALTRAQIDGLNRFLASNGEADGDHIEIRTSTLAGPGRNAAIADALRGSFLAGGYTPSRVEIIETPGSGDLLEVIIQRYTIVLPDCSHEIQRDNGLMEWSDEPVNIRKMGCSNEYNFGLMLADPRDLDGGRTLGESAGYREVGAVQRYRTDKVKELKTLSTTSGVE